MTRLSLPYRAEDISVLARRLGAELAGHEGQPGHLTLLNMLARGAGFRNFQHFRAQDAARLRLDPPLMPEVDLRAVEKVRRYFDAEARLKSWPAKTSAQHLALWGLWAQVPKGQSWTERAFSSLLDRLHLFGDAAILRRTMAQSGLIARQPDGTGYRRIEQAPPAEAVALIRSLRLSASAR
jgi:hypothetical protein